MALFLIDHPVAFRYKGCHKSMRSYGRAIKTLWDMQRTKRGGPEMVLFFLSWGLRPKGIIIFGPFFPFDI